MIWLLLSLVIWTIVFRNLFREPFLVINIVTAVLFLIGVLGTVPFFLSEYLSIPYGSSPMYVGLASLLLLVGSRYLQDRFFLPLKQGASVSSFWKRQSIPVFIVAFVCVVALLRSWILPVQGWDAFSMYDARARMIYEGGSFESFVGLSDYDNFNKNYYFSYPPMTSVIHAVMYSVGFVSPMLLYGLCYCAVIIVFWKLLKDARVSVFLQTSGLLVLTTNTLLLSQAGLAYTNMPMLAFQMMCMYYLLKFSVNPSLRTLIVSGVFLSFSNWTRNEPMYLSFIAALLVILSVYHSRSLHWIRSLGYLILYIFLSVILKLLWSHYLASTVSIVGLSASGIDHSAGMIVWRLLQSIHLATILEVLLFIYASLNPIMGYLLLFFCASYSMATINFAPNRKEIVLCCIVLTQMVLTIVGVFYFSQTYIWWDQIGFSMLRSSLFLIPVSLLFAIQVISNRVSTVFQTK